MIERAVTVRPERRSRRHVTSAARYSVILPPIVFGLLVLAGWQAAIEVFDIKGYIVASPLDIVREYRASAHDLWFNAELTIFESTVGFALGAATGAVLGIALAYSRLFERAFLPYVVAANTIPVVAIAPILILWLGQGAKSKIAVTAFLCFFPVCVNVMKGIRSTPRAATELMHVQAASRLQEFSKVRLPASLPYAFVGLKLGATFSVIGAIVAEFVGASRGLGYLMLQSSYLLNTSLLWASMFAAAALGIVMFVAVVLAERLLVPWHESTL